MKQTKSTTEGRKAEKSLREAVARVIEENRKLGLPVAVMQKGKAVLISAEDAVAQVREAPVGYKTRFEVWSMVSEPVPDKPDGYPYVNGRRRR